MEIALVATCHTATYRHIYTAFRSCLSDWSPPSDTSHTFRTFWHNCTFHFNVSLKLFFEIGEVCKIIVSARTNHFHRRVLFEAIRAASVAQLSLRFSVVSLFPPCSHVAAGELFLSRLLASLSHSIVFPRVHPYQLQAVSSPIVAPSGCQRQY